MPEPAQQQGPLRRLWSKFWWLVLGVGALGGFAAALELGQKYWIEGTSPEAPIKVAFNTLNACERGRLSGQVDTGYLRNVDQMVEGASLLTLCDSEPMEATPSAFAAKLADRYRGCLGYFSHNKTLGMRSFPDAICRYDTASGPRYFCMGERPEARQSPVTGQLVERTTLPDCTADFLRSIGLPG